ncbi:hypothetical protein FB556_2258 [Enteractinococcus coprophilus]|uniref:Uncharacterized protein n=1 Tax=Enteractinococcus coprophilus TaxID=1027633 RepID=A0A543AGW1_9MICC|nr:hypothetical protein FB556_2258 [Enteractinococcus coprophilus]
MIGIPQQLPIMGRHDDRGRGGNSDSYSSRATRAEA